MNCRFRGKNITTQNNLLNRYPYYKISEKRTAENITHEIIEKQYATARLSPVHVT